MLIFVFTFVYNVKSIWTLALVRSLQINASSSAARPIETFVDVDADVRVDVVRKDIRVDVVRKDVRVDVVRKYVRVDVVRKLEAGVAAAAEAAVIVDAIAVTAAQVGIGQALINVDTMTVFRLK